VLAIVLLTAGLLIATVGLLGLRERLPRNRFAGVRTAASMRDEATFRVANQVAGLPTIVGGLVGVLTGVAGLFLPGTGPLLVILLIGAAGMFGITLGAGVLGHRAAQSMPKPQPPAACGGCACGNCGITAGSR
jgi:SdpI/YfhL protein family